MTHSPSKERASPIVQVRLIQGEGLRGKTCKALLAQPRLQGVEACDQHVQAQVKLVALARTAHAVHVCLCVYSCVCVSACSIYGQVRCAWACVMPARACTAQCTQGAETETCAEVHDELTAQTQALRQGGG